jgi:S1-C subfamily serine protease
VQSIDLPPALREHFGAPAEAGVMISHVEAASPAEAAGFELGDVVFEVDGEQVRSTSELDQRVAGAGVGNDVEFQVARAGARLVLEARIEAAAEAPARP